ncbi:Haloacid dehalogenase-like hydrolase domain-containing protein 3, partial [Nowakowskiella sp. JEL0078]
RLITFDAFGTLFRVLGNPTAAYVREAARHGIHIQEEAATTAYKLAFRLQSNRYPNYGRRHESLDAKKWWEEVVKMTLVEAGAKEIELERKFDDIFETLFHKFTKADEYIIYDEVKPVLAAIKESPDVRLGVISNSDGRTVQVLQSLGLEKYFDFTITSYELNHEKPDMDIFNKALDIGSYGLVERIKPENALHIGDDEKRDYLGAKQAGWESYLLVREDEEHAPYFSGKVLEDNLINTLEPAIDW